MNPEQFDHTIRQKLESRTIEPDAKSWNAVSDALDRGNRTSRSKKTWVYPVAGFLLVLILSSIFYATDQKRPLLEPVASIKLSPVTGEIKPQHINPAPLINLINIPKKYPQAPEQNLGAIAKVPIKENELPVIQNIDKTVLPLEITAETVAAKIIKKARDGQITEAEVDRLINKALIKIRVEKLINNPDNKVSATALLKEAEKELNHSFRERVFKALDKSYNKVRIALISSNY